MNRVERFFYNLVRFHPSLKKRVVSIYQYFFSLLPQLKIVSTNPIQIHEGFFFGFHDKCPWSPDNTKLLAHKYTNPLMMPAADDEIQVGYFTAPDYDSFHQIGTTKTWNWQMGAMLQWLGDTGKIIYNDFIDNQHKAIIVNLNGDRIERLDRPVATISKDGKWAVSHSFIRLQKSVPAYGYANGIDSSAENACPDNDGLYLINLKNGEIRLLFTVEELARYEPDDEMARCYHYFTHPLFSPDGLRFIFFHRWVESSGQTWTRMFSCNRDGSDLHLFKTSGVVTHVAWKDDNTILAYAYKKEVGDHYYLFKDISDQFEILGKQHFSSDGHPQFSPDRKYFITDTYPDRSRKQRLILYDIYNNIREDLAVLRSPFPYRGDLRCDLHPRWNRDGTAICFDSSHTGKRALCIMNLN